MTWTPPQLRRRTIVEIWLVLGLSLGASAVYSIVAIIQRLVGPTPLSGQTATLNRALSEQPLFDLLYQVLSIFFALVPVALALYFLWQPGTNPFRRIGLDFTRFGRDAGAGVVLALAIGIPGIGLYLLGHTLGITVTIVPTALGQHWWTVPVLVLVRASRS